MEIVISKIVTGILVIAFLMAVLLVWFFIHKAKSRERLLLIEKGMDVTKLNNGVRQFPKFQFPWLKIGILVFCSALGLIIGVSLFWYTEMFNPGLFFFAFAGIGMILAHYIDKPKKQDNKDG